jgi:hypothetical protein
MPLSRLWGPHTQPADVLKRVVQGVSEFRYLLVESWDIEKLEAYRATFGYRLAEELDEHDYMFVTL